MMRVMLDGEFYAEWDGSLQMLAQFASVDVSRLSYEVDLKKALAENNTAYTAATRALTADYPQLEKDTWPTQDSEAAGWVADPETARTPWVDLAASERGLDREEYLRRTLVKAKQFKVLSAFLTGRRQKFEDAIKAGEDPALDYTLTPAVLAQLQQVATDGMTLPTDQLRDAM